MLSSLENTKPSKKHNRHLGNERHESILFGIMSNKRPGGNVLINKVSYEPCNRVDKMFRQSCINSALADPKIPSGNKHRNLSVMQYAIPVFIFHYVFFLHKRGNSIHTAMISLRMPRFVVDINSKHKF